MILRFFLPFLTVLAANYFLPFLGKEGGVCGRNLTILGIVLICLIFLYRKSSFFFFKNSRGKYILHISIFCFTLVFLNCFRSYAIAELGRFAAEFFTFLMGTCAVTGSSGSVGHGNPGNASSEWFTYTSDLEENSASSGRSRSISSVNQPAPPGPQHLLDGGAPQPLIVDEARRLALYDRYLVQNIGRSDCLQRMESILNSQLFIEKRVEAALVEDGFDPEWILRKYTDLRGYLHSPFGRILSERTYNSYVTQIENGAVRESQPYIRVLEALAAHDLLL